MITADPPPAPTPAEDLDLDGLFQPVIVGITGLDPTLVRPRWQPIPPKQPDQKTNWISFGTYEAAPDAGPYLQTVSTEPGSILSIRHEVLRVLVSCFGPEATAYAAGLRDGLGIPDNIDILRPFDIAFRGVSGSLRTFSTLVNQIQLRQCDMTLIFARKVTRSYGIHTIQSATIHLVDDTHVDDTITVPPP